MNPWEAGLGGPTRPNAGASRQRIRVVSDQQVAPTPAKARYCLGDVAGARGGHASGSAQRVQSRRLGCGLDAAPGFQLTTSARRVSTPVCFEGVRKVRGTGRTSLGPYEAVTVEPVEFFEASDQLVGFRDRVVAGEQRRDRGAGQHLWDDPSMHCPVSLRLFPEPEKALEAAGLKGKKRWRRRT